MLCETFFAKLNAMLINYIYIYNLNGETTAVWQLALGLTVMENCFIV